MSVLTHKLASALSSRDKDRNRLKLAPPSNPSQSGSSDFASNDYLALSRSSELRTLFLERLHAAPLLFGSGGSRILVNGQAYADLEARLASFFNAPAALVTTSGYDANVAFFRHIPQAGDVILHDEHIHASIYDGMRASKARSVSFLHNNVSAFFEALTKLVQDEPGVMSGATSVFLVVESLYSMDGTIAPLKEMSAALLDALPQGNGHLVVDEAHATGIYGPQGRGMVSMYGLEDKCLARLHTFGKAVSSTGAVLLTTPLVRDYILNYGRSFIFTTAPSYSNIISIGCSFDILESATGARLALQLLEMCTYFVDHLRASLIGISPDIIRLPLHLSKPSSPNVDTLATPIIPILTPYANELAQYLCGRGFITVAVVYPAVPWNEQRIRVSIHADKTRVDIDVFVGTVIHWAVDMGTPDERYEGGHNNTEVVAYRTKL
ncbi:pyridoxal phosphate-dependent transferase [Mycena polygramma]|nr:pyridoxal phosphate-dependent transferase [Mycena polygramma]